VYGTSFTSNNILKKKTKLGVEHGIEKKNSPSLFKN
jgi:hypothetical protein